MRAKTYQEIQPRMVPIPQGAAYCGMGRTTFRKWAIEIGALKFFGPKMLRVDLDIVDKALDALPAAVDQEPCD